MARKRNPARLVVALSIAAVLAVFLLYTSIAGGGTASISPSELGSRTGVVSLAGRVQPGYKGDAYGDGLRFRLRDIKGGSKQTVTVLYTGSVSEQFRVGREVTGKGALRTGVCVAVKEARVPTLAVAGAAVAVRDLGCDAGRAGLLPQGPALHRDEGAGGDAPYLTGRQVGRRVQR